MVVFHSREPIGLVPVVCRQIGLTSNYALPQNGKMITLYLFLFVEIRNVARLGSLTLAESWNGAI